MLKFLAKVKLSMFISVNAYKKTCSDVISKKKSFFSDSGFFLHSKEKFISLSLKFKKKNNNNNNKILYQRWQR